MLIRREAEIAHSQLVFARHVEPELALQPAAIHGERAVRQVRGEGDEGGRGFEDQANFGWCARRGCDVECRRGLLVPGQRSFRPVAARG